jgi:hypothetical protein
VPHPYDGTWPGTCPGVTSAHTSPSTAAHHTGHMLAHRVHSFVRFSIQTSSRYTIVIIYTLHSLYSTWSIVELDFGNFFRCLNATYRAILNDTKFTGGVEVDGRPITTLVDHTKLVTALRVQQPRAQIALHFIHIISTLHARFTYR